jgi:hypothetical protein
MIFPTLSSLAESLTVLQAGAVLETRRWRGAHLRHAGNVAIFRLSGWDELLVLLRERRPEVLILDVEPWLVGWGEPVDARTHADIGKLADAGDCDIVLCTNSGRFARESWQPWPIVGRAHKPWTSSRRLPREGRRMVAGDLLSLDGVLARRWTSDFAWLPWWGKAPCWPATLRVVDSFLATAMTRPAEA